MSGITRNGWAATAFGLAMTAALTAPVGAQETRCERGQEPLGSAVYTQATDTETLAAGRHRVRLCSDGVSHTLMVSESTVPARLSGCPAEVGASTFRNASVEARNRADGSIQIHLVSSTDRGCSAAGMLIPAIQKVREAGYRRPAATRGMTSMTARPEPDASRVSATTRRAFGQFWTGLPDREAAALERRLSALETRAERGENVRGELATIRRDRPELFDLSERLETEPWIVAPGEGDLEGSVECQGIGWIGRNGRLRCIGKLVVKN